MGEQVCRAEQELAEGFFAGDHGGTVAVSSDTVASDMTGDHEGHVWWRTTDPDSTTLVACRASSGRGPRSRGIGDVMIRVMEGLGPFEERWGELRVTGRGGFSIRQIG